MRATASPLIDSEIAASRDSRGLRTGNDPNADVVAGFSVDHSGERVGVFASVFAAADKY